MRRRFAVDPSNLPTCRSATRVSRPGRTSDRLDVERHQLTRIDQPGIAPPLAASEPVSHVRERVPPSGERRSADLTTEPFRRRAHTCKTWFDLPEDMFAGGGVRRPGVEIDRFGSLMPAYGVLVGAINPKAMSMALTQDARAAGLSVDFAAVYSTSDASPAGKITPADRVSTCRIRRH